MTTARIIGTSFGSGLLQAKNKWTENRDGSYQIERTFRALAAHWISECPQRGDTHPDNSQAILISRNATQSSIPFLADVTLIYETPRVDAVTLIDNAVLPPSEYAETANAVEAPIEAHPDFATFATIANGAIYSPDGKFNGWTNSSPYAGYMTYRVGSVTESTTTYFWSKPESATTQLGKVSGNWRVDSGSIQRRYPYWTRTINRVWSETGWNTTVYPQ